MDLKNNAGCGLKDTVAISPVVNGVSEVVSNVSVKRVSNMVSNVETRGDRTSQFDEFLKSCWGDEGVYTPESVSRVDEKIVSSNAVVSNAVGEKVAVSNAVSNGSVNAGAAKVVSVAQAGGVNAGAGGGALVVSNAGVNACVDAGVDGVKSSGMLYPRMMWCEKTYVNEPKYLCADDWSRLCNSEEVKRVCGTIREKIACGAKDDEIKALKNQLPVILPHVCAFWLTDSEGKRIGGVNGKRDGKHGVSNGLVMLDVDHHATPWELFAAFGGASSAKANNIVYVGISCSGRGLRVIGEREWGESIVAGQERLARLFHVGEYDKVTKDLARCSYCVPSEYILYVDNSKMYFNGVDELRKITNHFSELDNVANVCATKVEEPKENTKNTIMENKESKIKGVSAEAMAKNACEYKGISVYAIGEYIAKSYNGGVMPKEGNRNNSYMEMAKNVRCICDYNAAKLYANLPDLGLAEDERINICRRFACVGEQYMTNKVPNIVEEAVDALLSASLGGALDGARVDMNPDNVVMPDRLPKIFAIVNSTLGKDWWWPAVVSVLPMLGTVATGVRMKYIDNRTHSFSFLSCVMGEQTTGKSFFRGIEDVILRKIKDEMRACNKAEMEYKEQKAGGKKKLKKPAKYSRRFTLNFSPTEFYKKSIAVDGQHIYASDEEIDDLITLRKSAGRSLDGILKHAFDNSETGCNFSSEQSLSAVVNVYLNVMCACTPCALHEYFDKNVEDGVMTRFCFAELKHDDNADDDYCFGDFSDEQLAYIDELTTRLAEIKGMVYCPWINDATRRLKKEWNERLSGMSNSKVVKPFFVRALQKAFRIGYLASVCENDYMTEAGSEYEMTDNRQMVVEFMEACFNYLLRMSYTLFGGVLEDVQKISEAKKSPAVVNIYDMLPREFTRAEYDDKQSKLGKNKKQANGMLHDWKRHERIREVSEGVYVKLK